MARLILACGVLLLAASCNDSGNGNPPPEAAITFPPASSLTAATTITVTGTASDTDGVAEISVNGVTASRGAGGLGTWQANVPLVPGTNTLTEGTE